MIVLQPIDEAKLRLDCWKAVERHVVKEPTAPDGYRAMVPQERQEAAERLFKWVVRAEDDGEATP